MTSIPASQNISLENTCCGAFVRGLQLIGGAKMLELYHDNISVCAQKVRIALEEKEIEWEPHLVDLFKGEQVSSEYLAINPRGVTPTIVHEGHPVIESTVILEYLEDAFPQKPLRPTNAKSRAIMRIFAKEPDDGIHVACGVVSFAAAFAGQMLEYRGRAAIEDKLAKMPDRARAARQKELTEKGMRTGSWLRAILSKHEELRGTLFELPQVVAIAREAHKTAPYAERLEIISGDFFSDAIPTGHDSVLIANIFHNFTPEKNLALLARLRHGFPKGGRLLLVDLWTDPIHTEPVISALMAAEFLIHSAGDTYSEQDGLTWLEKTGWRKVDFRSLAGPVSLLVAEPKGD